MVMRWDAASGRYVNIAPTLKESVDTLPQGMSPYSWGAHYVDAVTGEDKIVTKGNKPDPVVVKDSRTGQWVHKSTGATAYGPKSGQPITPKKVETKPIVPAKNEKELPPLPPPNPAWTDNGWQNTPIGGTYVDTQTGETKKRMPQGQADKVIKPTAGDKPADNKKPLPQVDPKAVDNGWQNTAVGGTYVDTKTGETKRRNPPGQDDTVIKPADGKKPADSNVDLQSIVDSYIKQQFPDANPEQIAALSKLAGLNSGGSGGGGGGASGPSSAQKKASARIQTQAGKKAQSQYNEQAAQFMKEAQDTTGKYYASQQEQANKSIDSATMDYLNNLVKPTAYENVPVAQMNPEQQGLMQNLQAYGATGQQAQGQRTEDYGYNQFMSQLMSNSAQQLGQADKGYFDALRNAGLGGQMAARQGVAQNVANLQGQSLANADAVRRQLIQAGIEALMAGQQDAANTLAK